ncbi:GntR family transcriptional regulator [Streptomyces lunaelactis]|uniref:GntR family transcriptional regulator n=1 Tax=Streptomyces lunaelactis TaxID=1535768 RepID=UPI0020C76567|nr:GntR family transcriptional regulator [Streptomyces lunaelactis]
MGHLKQRNLVTARERLRDQVAHALRAALISGELRPGEVYSAPGLAEDFGVSATPVREAMLDLAREGLVEPMRNKGFRVTEVNERDLDQYTEIRTLIEVPMVGRITRSASREDLEALRPVAEEIVRAARDHDLIGYLEADRQFHLTLLGLSGNERLVETVGVLRKRPRLYGLTALDERDQLLPSAEEHLELLDLMLAGDAQAAEACMTRHLGHVRSLWAQGLKDAEIPAARRPGLEPEAAARRG